MSRWVWGLETLSKMVRYFILYAPSALTGLILIFAASALIGELGRALSPTTLFHPEFDGWVFGVMFIGTPAAIGGLIAGAALKQMRPQFMIKTEVFTAFIWCVLIGVLYIIGVLVYPPSMPAVFPFDVYRAYRIASLMALGYVICFSDTFAVNLICTGLRASRAIVPSAFHFLIGMGMLLMLFSTPAHHALLLALSSRTGIAFLILLAVGLFVLLSMNRAVKRGLNVNIEDLVKSFLAAFIGERMCIDKEMYEIGEDMEANIDMLCFKRGETLKAVLVSSDLHPGPMRGSGSFDLPARVADELSDVAPVAMLHGASTHDQDPVFDVSTEMSAAIRSCLNEVTYGSTATRVIQAKGDTAQVMAQAFDNMVMLCSTFAPEPTDDVSHNIGERIRKTGAEMGVNLFYVDCHHVHGEQGYMMENTPREEDLMRASEEALKMLAEAERVSLRAGISYKSDMSMQNICMLLTEVGESRTLYITFNANNMFPEAREHVLNLFRNKVDLAEVFTSDSHHSIDPARIHNPMTLEEAVELDDVLQSMFEEAINDLGPMEAGAASTKMPVRILGPDTVKLIKRVGLREMRRTELLYFPVTMLGMIAAAAVLLL